MRTTKRSEWKALELRLTVHENPPLDYAVPIRSSEDAYNILCAIWDPAMMRLQEQFYVLYLNSNNKPIGYKLISTGRLESVEVDVRLIVMFGILCRAASVIIAHNHPSELALPSIHDHGTTSHIKERLAMFDMKLMDHLIVSPGSYYSFLDNRDESLLRGRKMKW